MSNGVGLLSDQIEETQAALIAADAAGDAEGAKLLAGHLQDLETQYSAVQNAEKESSQSATNYKNPLYTGGVGAAVGAAANPVRNQISAVMPKVETVPEISAPHPTSFLQQEIAPKNQNWTKSLTGVDVPGSQMNKQSLDTAQRMAATISHGGELAGGSVTPGGVLLGPQIGAKPPAPTPMIPRNLAQAKEKGMNVLQAVVGEHQPSRPFDIIKGGSKGAIAGAALGDIPQQVAQGNIGTAATDVGLSASPILHGLSTTKKGKAIANLLGLGAGVARTVEGVNELNAPVEQKAGGGLIGNIASQIAVNAPYMVPEIAGLGKNVAKGAYAPAMENAASLGLALAPLNPLTAAMSMMAPGEAGAGSTVDDWNARKAAEQAARIKAQKKLEHEQFLRQQVGANAPQHLNEYLVQQAVGKAQGGEIKKPEAVGYAPGGKVGTLAELLNLVRNRGGSEAAKRIERAADLVPNLEHQYQPQALERAFTGDNAQAVMVMDPKNFEKYAAPIDTGYKSSVMETYGIGDPEKYGGYNAMPKGTYQDYINYLGQFTKPGGGGLSDVPYLQLGQELNSSFPAVLGHEGRHRTAAMEKLGDQSTLVRMMPRAALREPFPRRSQEEYLEALVNQIGQKPLVKPQVFRDDAGKDVRRGLIELPEMFAAGGLAEAFDPEGSDYDYQTATAHGMGPTGTGENTGHWGSVAPAPTAARQQHNLPEDSYVVLKGRSHPTFNKAEAAENARGSEIVKLGDRYYSVPKK